jgi:hypothetical protein
MKSDRHRAHRNGRVAPQTCPGYSQKLHHADPQFRSLTSIRFPINSFSALSNLSIPDCEIDNRQDECELLDFITLSDAAVDAQLNREILLLQPNTIISDTITPLSRPGNRTDHGFTVERLRDGRLVSGSHRQ